MLALLYFMPHVAEIRLIFFAIVAPVLSSLTMAEQGLTQLMERTDYSANGMFATMRPAFFQYVDTILTNASAILSASSFELYFPKEILIVPTA